MTLRPASGSAEMSDEEMPPEQDEISNDEEIRTTQSSEGPVSKVAVRQGLNIHPGVSKCTELTGDTSVIDAVDANESKIEDITKKLDDLARLVQRLEVRPDQSLSQRSTINANLHTTNKSSRPPQTSTPDHEGIDISLLLNVIQVADLLETALDHEDTGDQSSTVADIRLSRQTLQDVLRSQNHGTTTVPWLGETMSFGDFTLIIVQVCSPGPITDVKLIIALSGLYWMFNMCRTWASPVALEDFKDQARLCQNSLETVLSTLNFWLPATVDAVLAMNLASVYCLQKGKIYACWTFINKAAMLGQALGLHQDSSSSGLASEERHRRFCLFWSTYCIERPTALRLGRPSTIRDEHITIPKPDQYPTLQGLTSSRQSLIHAVEMSRLHGSAYDDLFSPSALALPATHRTTRGQAIAAEWRALIASKESSMARWDEDSRGTIGELMPVEFAQHATRATDYLLLVAIYRVAFSKPSTKVSSECIAAARTSLREHTQCIALLVSYNNDPALFELWVNGGLILFAFVPFNIIFCSVIETANLADLESLETYVDALASLAKKPEYTSCAKQLEIFRALHKLALVHSEIRAQMQLSSCPSGPLSSSAKDAGLEGLPDTLGGLPSWHDRDGMWNGSINTTNEPSVLASQPWADFGGMDLDPLGTQLGYWIQESSQDFDNFGET
ncbi:unnamed protein product [Alternaria alternata]